MFKSVIGVAAATTVLMSATAGAHDLEKIDTHDCRFYQAQGVDLKNSQGKIICAKEGELEKKKPKRKPRMVPRVKYPFKKPSAMRNANREPVNPIKLVGDLWAMPMTIALGLPMCAMSLANGGKMIKHKGGIAFTRNPLVQVLGAGAMTTGHVYSYNNRIKPWFVDNEGNRVEDHEYQHLKQFRVLGSTYPIVYGAAAAAAAIQGHKAGGEENFLEKGPYATPPRAWP